jgi:DNA-binding NtrC family response regulator
MSRVLIVDDHPAMRETMAQWLQGCGHTVSEAGDGHEALQWLARQDADALVTDLRMPGLDGLQLLEAARKQDPDLVILLVTAHGGVDEAVKAMRLGADDFLVKPFPMEELEVKLAKALARRHGDAKRRSLEAELGPKPMLGESAALKKVQADLAKVAASHSNVLLYGESGTGKELAARAIHAQSPWKDGPFVSVHCAALAPGLLESELFGHEKGAFTGAVSQRAGRFELAKGGTLFMDEVSEIPLETQVKLLRVLQEREFERVGGTRTLKADFRLVAASNRDLQQAVKQGRFREDLYFRVSVVQLTLPPLRERLDDLPALAEHFARRFCAEQGKAFAGLDPACLPGLKAYDWPGNIRELQNLVEQAVVFAAEGPLSLRPGAGAFGSGAASPLTGSLDEVLAATESRMIQEALAEHGGVQNRAAQKLGLSRSALQYKIRKYQLEKLCRGQDEA